MFDLAAASTRSGLTRGVLLACVVAAGLASCVTPESNPPGPVDYPGWREDGQMHFGTRDFANTDLMPGGEDQLVMGLELYGAPEAAFLSVEFGLWTSAPYDGSLDDWFDSISGYPDEETEDPSIFVPTVEGSSSIEASLGLRKELALFDGFLRPYVSGGVSLLRARSFVATGAQGVEEGDTTWGYYGQVGLQFALTPNARVGIAWRAFEGQPVDLLGVSGRPDYRQLSFTLGFSY
ncbi:outer membrane protein [Engelhardtia mirabilis]|uniref:Outer membrane protein beta-barrel domain-containing protein n=1 Tax=Engelhardtia mirabilis TaxID=2528011 RepID=A0A518BIR3_9BACT|nr:hypothetical protein Pla133_19430 [Planctomycetes bacterium Pla133]QDV01193.1 hypothetical protein Pla86_19420 [Planctomycetes bacterium Pla86]